MPRTIDSYWRPFVIAYKADGKTAKFIEIQLDAMERPEGVGPPPRERTIRDIVPSDDELDNEQWLRWPGAMGSPGLPWEASADMLHLLMHFYDGFTRRPTLRQARWYWRLRQAAGDSPPSGRMLESVSAALAGEEAQNGEIRAHHLAAIEAIFAHRVWEPEGARAYLKNERLQAELPPARELMFAVPPVAVHENPGFFVLLEGETNDD